MRTRLLGAVIVCTAAVTQATIVDRFAVNEYFGVEYVREPVSHEVSFAQPVVRERIGVASDGTAVPCQVEIIEGTPQAVTRARVWIAVDFPHVSVTREEGKGDARRKVTVREPGPPDTRHRIFEVIVASKPLPPFQSPVTVTPAGTQGGIALADVAVDGFHARIPVKSSEFDAPVSPFVLPGPVVSVSRDGARWVGTGYLDSMKRVRRVTCRTELGPVFFESQIEYLFEGDRRYTVTARVYGGKPFVHVVEDFNVGGASRFVFSFDDWLVDGFFYPGDQRLYAWESITAGNPCGDFVTIPGQKALSRLVIWSQFNYFRGKQETISVKSPDPSAIETAHIEALEQYQEALARNRATREDYERKLAAYRAELARYNADPESVRRTPKPPREPRLREPTKPEKPVWREEGYTLAGATIRTGSVVTPGGTGTAVGGFLMRPDRWTRAKPGLFMRLLNESGRKGRGQGAG